MKLFKFIFSPTGGTQKAADILAEGLAACGNIPDTYSADFGAVCLAPEDIALIAVPSYAGRVPEAAMKRLAAVRGNGARAVLLCVYGNRAFEDTLVELANGAKLAGFKTAAAAAAIAEHSIAHTYAPAAGRPDAQDEKNFQGRNVLRRLFREIAPTRSGEPWR